MNLPERDDYECILLAKGALLDVRAPVEFAEGGFPTSVNLPLLDDDQRAQVGKRYKDQGQEAAIALGHKLVNAEVRESRVRAWSELVQTHPGICIYCARGGLRSQISQTWLSESGVEIPRVKGGYKALRNFGVAALERTVNEMRVVVVSGRTGVAKTRLIQRRNDSVDLEGLAHHRGSAFGNWPEGQPRQASFDNQLVCRVLELKAAGAPQLVLEDEGRHVCRVSVPASLVKVTSEAPLGVIEATMEERIDETITGYITESLAAWSQGVTDDVGFEKFSEALLESVDRIKKRLGGARHTELRKEMTRALSQHRASGDKTCHAGWIRTLLEDYYDPMYDYQLDSRKDRIAFSGSLAEVDQWLDEVSVSDRA